jgi:hypothetical protein
MREIRYRTVLRGWAKGTLVRLLTRSDPFELLRALIDVFARTVEPVRPRRLYPRRKGLHGYHMAYKPCS